MTFLQGRLIDGQETHEQKLAITNYYGNANQKHNEVSLHTGENGHYFIYKINGGEGVEKRKPSYTAGGDVTCYSHYGE